MKYIINDVGRHFSFPGVVVLNADECTERIRDWDRWSKLPRATTVVVFPGNGARDVRARLGQEWLAGWQVMEVWAKRFWWPGSFPVSVVGPLPLASIFDFRTTDVVIIDDVISSGGTVNHIRAQNMICMTKVQGWHAVTWVKQRACRLPGFASVFAGVEVGEATRRAPVNSLSTLIEEVEIAESYARRNFSNPEAFLALIDELR